MLAGRIRVAEQDWLFDTSWSTRHRRRHDRAVYDQGVNSADAIRASNGWYQAFAQDVADNKNYGALDMPVLVLAGPAYQWMKAVVGKNDSLTALAVPNSGHFVQEEQPEFVSKTVIDFLQNQPASKP